MTRSTSRIWSAVTHGNSLRVDLWVHPRIVEAGHGQQQHFIRADDGEIVAMYDGFDFATRYAGQMSPSETQNTTRRERRIDIGITAALLVLAVFEHFAIGDLASDSQTFTGRGRDLTQLALEGLMIVPLLARRRFPIVVLVATHIGFVILNTMDYAAGSASQFAVLMSFYGVALYSSPRRADVSRGSILVVLMVWMAIGATQDAIPAGLVPIVGAIYIAVWIMGNTSRARRHNQVLLEERALRAEREQKEQSEEAVRGERARIARELHDVVAHSLTVMTVQAAGARRVISADRDQASNALSMIETTGREALSEMRRMIGVMRSDDQPLELTPQPGIDTLEVLIDSMRESGLSVTW